MRACLPLDTDGADDEDG